MFLLLILVLIAIVLIAATVLGITALGAGAVLLFGDVIVCVGVIGFIIYKIIRKKFR